MRLVVIGGVAAGLSAAARARRLDPQAKITVLEKGTRVSYGACGLPYFIEGQVQSVDQLVAYTAQYFANERQIEVRTRSEVAGIAHHRREVSLAGGERLPYDKLVYACGASPQRWNHPRAFNLHTDCDAERLQQYLHNERPQRAAVIGGGYIGLEMATALRARGLSVTVYDAGTLLLGWQDEQLTRNLIEVLIENRIAVQLATRIQRVEDTGADFAIVAAGVTPNVALAAEAGIETGRTGAIQTDEHQETNLTGVYAAGDCAEALNLVTGRPAWIPLGTTANKQGRVAGANAVGTRERFEGITGTSIVRVGGVGVATTGLSESQARREGFHPVRARIDGRDRARYFNGEKVTVDLVADRTSGRLLGGAVLGTDGVPGRINTIAAALTARMKVEAFAQLDLAYSPPYATVMDPLLIAAQQLLKNL